MAVLAPLAPRSYTYVLAHCEGFLALAPAIFLQRGFLRRWGHIKASTHLFLSCILAEQKNPIPFIHSPLPQIPLGGFLTKNEEVWIVEQNQFTDF